MASVVSILSNSEYVSSFQHSVNSFKYKIKEKFLEKFKIKKHSPYPIIDMLKRCFSFSYKKVYICVNSIYKIDAILIAYIKKLFIIYCLTFFSLNLIVTQQWYCISSSTRNTGMQVYKIWMLPRWKNSGKRVLLQRLPWYIHKIFSADCSFLKN